MHDLYRNCSYCSWGSDDEVRSASTTASRRSKWEVACSTASAGSRFEEQSDMTLSCLLERLLRQTARESLGRGIGSRALGEKHQAREEPNRECEARQTDACGCEHHFECQGVQEQVHSQQVGRDMGPLDLSWYMALELRGRKGLEAAAAEGAADHMRHRAECLQEAAHHAHRQYERARRRALWQILA
jgi:hypothetical protein